MRCGVRCRGKPGGLPHPLIIDRSGGFRANPGPVARTDRYTKSRRMAFSYRAPLPTVKNEWAEVAVPLEDFIPTSFGRRVQGMGPVESGEIISIGFMLSDKKAGPFTMQIEWVKVARPGE